MAKWKHAAWIGAAWAAMTCGCGALVGLEDGYYLQGGQGGGSGPGAASGSGPGEGGGSGPGGDCSGGACSAPPSCAGLEETCGPRGDESCCASMEVAGGSFKRDNDERYSARVSGFLLDRFEVTVGRFRKFVEAYPGSKPAAGAGKHPLIDGSGWDDGWNNSWLPANAAALKEAVRCDPTLQTWTDVPEAHEHLPMNCLSWYLAFAFCAWDGGRLPTEAEWNYAAAGGEQQREYPWPEPQDAPIDGSYAAYDCAGDGAPDDCELGDILPVGSRPKGDGRWGQADLAGNMWEWILDWYADYPEESCDDCANMAAASGRVVRGGAFVNDASYLPTYYRTSSDPADNGNDTGVRCARDR